MKQTRRSKSPKIGDGLPTLKSFSMLLDDDGLWHLVTLTSAGGAIVSREVGIGDQKAIVLMKAWLGISKEAKVL